MMDAEPPALAARLPPLLQWALLVLASGLAGGLFEAIGIPAALLIGPMLGAIALSVAGGTVAVGRWPYRLSQALIGCLIASSFKPSIVGTISHHLALFLAVVLATYAASLALGWTMSRLKILPGSTAVWGSAPGAASAMMVMAEAFGADPRLVAFMQYLRVVFVAVTASVVARVWVGDHGGAAHAIQPSWFPPLDAVPFAETLALVGIGAVAGWRLRIPAGPLLVPMVVGGILRATGAASFDLPPWLLALAYACIGWRIGLGFTRAVIRRAARVAIPMALNVAVLIAICGGLAFVLVRVLGVDPLTAYLATSPGGMDSIAIIAASSKTDLPFVMALHAMRFLIVLTAGPSIARFVATRAERDGRR